MKSVGRSPRGALGVLLAAAAIAAPAAASAQAQGQDMITQGGRPVLGSPRASMFKCQGGGDLTAHFDTQGAQLVAIVDTGDGPHVLPLRPWVSGDGPQVTWTDGRRTLVWTPGVHLQFSEGASNRGCSRGGGEHVH